MVNYTCDPRLSIFRNVTFKFDPDKFIIVFVLIFALCHNVCFSSSFLSSSSCLRRCPVVSFNTVFISTSLYCRRRPPPPPPAPYWRSCQSWRCQDSPCSTVLQLEKIFTSNIVIIIDNLSMYECQNKIGDHYPAAGGGSEAGPVWGEVQELVPGTLEGSEPPQPGVLGRDVVSAGVHHKLNCNCKLQTNFDCDHFNTARPLHSTEPRLQNQLSK